MQPAWYPTNALFAGPAADYQAAAAAATTAQGLTLCGTSGPFAIPIFPAWFWQFERTGQAVFGTLAGKVTASTTATTMTIALGVATTFANASSATPTLGLTLVTSPAVAIGSTTANIGWEFDFKILCRQAGTGTTATSTSLLTNGTLSVNTPTATANTGQGVAAPNSITTYDNSISYWLTATVTFSTSSATNSATLQQIFLLGLN